MPFSIQGMETGGKIVPPHTAPILVVGSLIAIIMFMIMFGVIAAGFTARTSVAYVPITIHANYAVRIDDKSMWKELVQAIKVGRLALMSHGASVAPTIF
jgi:hypothetical protein